ncbi:ATP-binding protein [Streptomyces sp. NPDC091292]|uniref:ATP-binding protein n=1 Tax=Streptomyces sp. NPDC091292 TaxID=3365991 RepID=UPI0037F5AEC2
MSLPLTRRIARVALLVAAGAAPVVGAAGSASAVDLPTSAPLGGLTALDGASVGNNVDGAAQKVTKTAGETGGTTVKKAVPAAGKTVGKGAKTAAPAAQKAAGDVGGSAGEVLGGVTGAAAPGAGQLPVNGLPLG